MYIIFLYSFYELRPEKLFVLLSADVAQLAEQLICNQQVTGSSPVVGFDRI